MYVTFNDVVQPANFANYINRNIELATVTSGNNTHVSYRFNRHWLGYRDCVVWNEFSTLYKYINTHNQQNTVVIWFFEIVLN